jgi:hypothetical protein
MVVVGQHDTASAPHGSHHLANRGSGIGEMLQEKTCVNHVERAPLLLAERE